MKNCLQKHLKVVCRISPKKQKGIMIVRYTNWYENKMIEIDIKQIWQTF